ncbi:BACON domain-containing protein [Flavobacterium sp. 14A]|uniref:BACON domain-containing protein n=1 Tax=Flavobacterium sp. 14A TaxID=2735896 RepID=UPI00156DE0DE|nr:BACON domain-containing protein [Flavobacterium sp. 14A]NRT11546.1 hypothetical protein [Flavobacterium sp. 14A]
MAKSKITIDFTSVPNTNDFINIRETKTGRNINERFVKNRIYAGECSLPNFQPSTGTSDDRFLGSVGDFYSAAVEADYNQDNKFFVFNVNDSEDSGIGIVTIVADFDNAVFEVVSKFAPATITITNETVVITPPVEPTHSVSPTALLFDINSNIIKTTVQPISVKTAGAWSITSLIPSWLQLSSTSGSGNTTVQASLKNQQSQQDGDYSTVLEFKFGSTIINVAVNLSVERVLFNPFLTDKLYFTKELEYLSFDTKKTDTYFKLNVDVTVFDINTNAPTVYNREYDFPLFQGKGLFHIGTIAHALLNEIENLKNYVPSFNTNYLKSQIKPVEITINFCQKFYNNDDTILTAGTIPVFKMIKGHKPFVTSSQLALLTVAQQDIMKITPDSFIGVSFVCHENTTLLIKKNNALIESHQLTPDENSLIQSYYRFTNDFQPGDSIDLILANDLETRTQHYLVHFSGMESTFFLFENENGAVEPFEFTGRRRIFTPVKHTLSPVYKNRYAFDKKVKAELSQTMIINTGFLGKSDHKMLVALTSSINVWASMDDARGPYLKVDATTTKIANQDTSSSEESQDIEFNFLENAHASIYPR